MADFGFARLSDDPGATHISTQVKGTAGYMDPEYLRTYQLTEKSDVYSFGVLLVEMITGRHPIEPKRPVNERVTIRWVSMLNLYKTRKIVFLLQHEQITLEYVVIVPTLYEINYISIKI